MTSSTDIYARGFCAKFDYPALQQQLFNNDRCVAYRNVLYVELPIGNVFVFDYGVVVFWGADSDIQNSFIKKITEFAQEPLTELVEDEFTCSIANTKSTIKNDHILLPDMDVLTRLAISHGVAQSTKLAQFELTVQQTISDTNYIPKNIAETGESHLSRKALAKLRGRLFITKSNIMLHYDLLDVPDFFWEYPELDSYYRMIADYLEISQRVDVLSKKLETIHELFGMMADEQKHKHSSQLEWVIIWLIAFEIVVFLVHDILGWL